jgi:hypothetical protein
MIGRGAESTRPEARGEDGLARRRATTDCRPAGRAAGLSPRCRCRREKHVREESALTGKRAMLMPVEYFLIQESKFS